MTIKTTIFTDHPRVSLTLLITSQSIADYVIMTRQLWRDHMNNDNSLDIDFIRGDIHGRSCMK